MAKKTKFVQLVQELQKKDRDAPYDLIIAVAEVLGWEIGIEEGDHELRGLSMGTKEYMTDNLN